MTLYTKTGDDGTTGLVHGQRVSKDCRRIEACGAVDELNSAVGFASAASGYQELSSVLEWVQHGLFDLGVDLMTLPKEGENSRPAALRVGPGSITEIERHVDAVMGRLSPLDRFVLPGGSELAARLHMARTACRLAERRVVALGKQDPVCGDVIVYLNRLSDLLFAMARRANQLERVEDVPWTGGGH